MLAWRKISASCNAVLCVPRGAAAVAAARAVTARTMRTATASRAD